MVLNPLQLLIYEKVSAAIKKNTYEDLHPSGKRT